MIRRQSGQAAIELAALAPVLALAVLVFAQLALAFRAELAAERAAGRAQAASVLGPTGARGSARGRTGGHACPAARRRAGARRAERAAAAAPQLARVHLSRHLAS